MSSVSVSCSTAGQLKDLVSAKFENRNSKNYTPSRRLLFQFPNIGAERTPVGARCRRGRVLRVRIVLYSGSVEGLCERDIRKSSKETIRQHRQLTFQFPNSGVERTLVDARRRHRRVLRVLPALLSLLRKDERASRRAIREEKRRICSSTVEDSALMRENAMYAPESPESPDW